MAAPEQTKAIRSTGLARVRLGRERLWRRRRVARCLSTTFQLPNRDDASPGARNGYLGEIQSHGNDASDTKGLTRAPAGGG